ncbi:MAG: four helix bundle protein [bacterium]|nr:four helix bundle protein [bacterium]
MNKFIFENLDVYQKSIEFINEIFNVSEEFKPKHQSSLGDQLRRSSLSIANNIAEGIGRKYKKEKKQFLHTSVASAFECIPALKIALLQKEITEVKHDSLYQECYVISKMLTSLINSIDNFRE